jgi:hypothetical protein
VVIALVVLGVGWKMATRPPPLDDAVAAFTEDWNDSDTTAVTERFAVGLRPKVSRWLTRKSSRRDWSSGLPSVQETRVVSQSDTRARVTLATHDGVVETTWKLEENEWSLSSIKVDSE